ncbi:MAG: single-stranded-DNA-specific exonuclease RecJ [Clostridia bacterium]|nr:single-stranded-DNA-specific exonuclease RecJ [Clostridia bacterium]
MQVKRWNIAALNTELAAELAEACEIHPFLSLLFTSRGIDTPEQVYEYLVGHEEEIDPFSFIDMELAVTRIRRAVLEKEKILVYGDYDADGVTATALLVSYLRSKGTDVIYRVPLREEGYGLHPQTIEWAAQQGVQLLITVDTGVTAVDEVALANAAGIDVVVTDHHQPVAELPAAVAVVDPHRVDCESGCTDFAGVGVAFMLVCALEEDGDRIFTEYGDLLTLGTLGDVMPLQGLNRDLMRRGILLLEESGRPGLVALREVAGLADKSLTASTISFGLTPRLNAAGRMSDPDIAVRLLLCTDSQEAAELAQQIQQINTERQTASNEIVRQAESLLEQHPEWLYDRVIVVGGEGWHSGLLGLVASRLMERYGKPAIAMSFGADGVAHGSCRSVEGFSLYEALLSCSNLLTVFGGHELAAGVTLPVADVETFRRAVNEYAARQHPQMPTPSLDIAVRLRPDQINTEKLELLQVLEPYGAGNPVPLFGLFRMQLDNITALGGGKHLRLSLSRDGIRINAVKFQTSPEEFPIPCGATVNCVVSLDRNEYRGNITVSVRIRDVSFADTDRERLAADIDTFSSVMRQEIRPVADCIPAREQLGRLYNLLRTCGEWNGTAEQLHHAIGETAPTVLQMLITLELWQQAGLIRWYDRGERLQIKVLPADGKADLTTTPLYRYLKGDEESV